jgi:hypothetical protein
VPNNPFHFNLPTRAEEFVGRHSILNSVALELCSLSGRNSYGVVAGRRAGKSSLLIAIEDRLLKRLSKPKNTDLHVLPILFSLKNLQFDSPPDIYGFALHRLRIATSGPRRAPPFSSRATLLDGPPYSEHNAKPATLQDLEAAIEQVVTAAYATLGLARVVFLIDEMDEVLEMPWTPSFFGNLRSLIYDGPVRDFVRLVVAGSGRYLDVDEKGSQLFNAIKPLFLDPLSKDGIEELILRAGKVEPRVAAEVVNQAGGHPFILQHILYHLFERGIEGAALEDVGTEVRRFIFDRGGDLSGWWNAIGEDGRRVYCSLRKSKDWKTVPDLMEESNDLELQADRGFKALCYHGVVMHDGTYQKYRFNGQLFRDWSASQCRALESSVTDAVGGMRKRVFISYSHKDKKLFNEFKTMLAPAIRKGIADIWDDERIAPGTKWKEEIETALKSAKVALLLVSQHFLASDFIANNELPPLLKAAQDQGVVILWVCLSSCLYEQSEIAAYQAAHDVSKPLDRLDRPNRWAVISEVSAKLLRLK